MGHPTAFTALRVTPLVDFLLASRARRPRVLPLFASGPQAVALARSGRAGSLAARHRGPDPFGGPDRARVLLRPGKSVVHAGIPAGRDRAVARASPRSPRQGLALVALVVGVYCAFRWFDGVSAEEYLVQRVVAPRLDDRFAGSLLSANQLSTWCGTVIPFCLALAIAWRGRWRLVALIAIAGLLVALLALDVRIGTPARSSGCWW